MTSPFARVIRTFVAPLALLGCGASQPAHGPSASPSPAPRLPPTSWRPAHGPEMEQLLNVHRSSAPSASRDGSTVAFLSDAPGVPQVFTVHATATPTAESQWARLTHIDDRFYFARFTPDDHFVFTGHDHGGDENVQLTRVAPTGDGLADLTHAPRVKYLFGAVSDASDAIAYASNERSTADFDIYTAAANGENPTRVFDGTGHFEAPAFSHGSGEMLALVHEHSSFDTDVHVLTRATRTARLLTTHTGDVRFTDPHFTADNHALFVLSDRDREFMNVAVIDLASSQLQFVIDDPHDVDLLAVSRSATSLAVAVNIDGWHELRIFDTTDPLHPRAGAAVQLPRVVITALDYSADGRTLVLAASGAALPDEIFRVDVATGHATRVTQSDHAGIAESTLVEPTVERIRSFDGVEIPVLLYRPRGASPTARLPVVVSVHGGPEAQATPNFSAVTQFLVGHGYIVAAPNVRGSTGYGKRYAHLDDVARREDSVHDLAELNRWLRTRADVDPDRIAVMGGSYGGYMTLAAITLYPALWSAACDIVGIANFRTFLQNTAPYRRALREAEYGTLANDGELLDRISPIRRVDQIRVPLFVIQGSNDPRVPAEEAEQIVAAVRARGLRVEYLRFANEGHGINHRENKITAYGAVARFFDRVMLGE